MFHVKHLTVCADPLEVNQPRPATVNYLTARLARHDNKGSNMFKRGLLLVLCATASTGCVVHPAHLRFTPPRVDVVVDGHSGHNNGDYNNGGGHHRHRNGH
jgi:hypothetical protein